MAKCDADTSLGGYVDVGFQKKNTLVRVCFFFSTTDTWCLNGQIAVSSQKKNLQIVTLSISILKTLFGDYDMSMIKIEPDEKTDFLFF